jgi:hypothetical protein
VTCLTFITRFYLSSQSQNPSVLTQTWGSVMPVQDHIEVCLNWPKHCFGHNTILTKLSFWPKMCAGQKCVPAKTTCRPNILFRKSVLAKWRYVVMNDSCSGAYLPDGEAIQTFGLHLSSCLRPCFHDSVEQLHMNEVVSYRLSYLHTVYTDMYHNSSTQHRLCAFTETLEEKGVVVGRETNWRGRIAWLHLQLQWLKLKV